MPSLLKILAVSPPFGAFGQMGNAYRIYRRDTVDGTAQMVAEVSSATLELDVSGASPSEAWYNVRAVSSCGVEDVDPASNKQVRVAFDSSGDLILPVPSAPIELTLAAEAAGRLILYWSWTSTSSPVLPDQFNIYIDSAGGASPAFAYTTPDHVVAYSRRRRFELDLGTFADALLVRVVVRAQSAAGDEEANTNIISATADAVAPGVAVIASTEVIAQ